jgi:hypothetical protein
MTGPGPARGLPMRQNRSADAEEPGGERPLGDRPKEDHGKKEKRRAS